MSAVIHARVTEQLLRLRLRYVAERLDAVLNDAARTEPTYLDFLDSVLRQEVEAKQRTRVTMALKIAHFPSVKSLDDFEFKFQPSVDQRLVRELATGRCLAQAENVLLFGAPGVGKTHLAIALGRAIVEAGHSVLFSSATALLAALAKAETEGQLADRLLFYSKPKLLIIDELGYLPFERRSAHLFFQPVARRYERGSMLITTNQLVTQWGTVFGDEVLAAAILDRLLHHSHTLMIQGESYRLRQKKKAGLLGNAPKHFNAGCGRCRSRGRTERAHRSLENRTERGFPQRPQPSSSSIKRGSVLVLEGGQKILSLDMPERVEQSRRAVRRKATRGGPLQRHR